MMTTNLICLSSQINTYFRHMGMTKNDLPPTENAKKWLKILNLTQKSSYKYAKKSHEIAFFQSYDKKQETTNVSQPTQTN